MVRNVSLYIRKLQARKGIKRTLRTFGQWKHEIARLPVNTSYKKLLIIRLDDIGDYLLFRNTLPAYRNASEWAGYEITLLGLALWRDLFEFADSAFTDKAIWVDKKQYFADDEYRHNLWQSLRSEGYEVVICPSRVRPLLIDDMCMLAANPKIAIAGANDFFYRALNSTSDHLYNRLFSDKQLSHEFRFNNAFANWCCGQTINLQRPVFPSHNLHQVGGKPYLICFMGASFKSRRWTTERWISFISLCLQQSDLRIVLAGGKADAEEAAKVQAATGVENQAGKLSLVEMAALSANAAATVTNDTMAGHLSISFCRPTVIIASGDNFYKFSAYHEAGISHVATIYPDVFLRKWQQHQFKAFPAYVAVTEDIGTISEHKVLAELTKLLGNQQ